MDKKRSSYFRERNYKKDAELETDQAVVDYWKKVIGENEYEDILEAYGLEENTLLFSDEYDVDTAYFNDIEAIEDMFVADMGKEIELQIVKDKKQKLVFDNFFIPFIKLGVYLLHQKTTNLELAFEYSYSHTLLERLCQISIGTLMFEMQLNKREGNLVGKTSREEYLYYNQKYLNDRNYVLSLFDIYPCLERLVFENIYFLTENYTKMIRRFEKDHFAIIETFCDGLEFEKPVEVQASISDSHRKGNTVAIISLDNGKKVVYKPRALKAEKAYQDFICDISSKCANKLKPVHMLDCNQYGWEEYIQAEPCHTLDELRRYYYRFGVLIFANYILNANDLHVENVIAMGEYPMVIDAETILDNKRTVSEENARDLINDMIHESVLYAGLLPYYRFSRKGKGVNMSAINGQGGEEYPILLPRVKDAGTSDMRYEYERPISQENNNLAKLENDFMEPGQFVDNICSGFSDAYGYVMNHTWRIPEWLDMFTDLEVRHLVQDTQRYSMLLHTSYHPYFLQDGKDRQLFLGCLFKEYEKVQGNLDVVKSEIAEMLHMDVPYFYLNTSKTLLYGGDGAEVKQYFPCTSIQHLKDKLSGMNSKKLAQQVRFIKIALTDLDKCEKKMAFRNFSMLLDKADERVSYTLEAVDKITNTLVETAVYGKAGDDVNWIGITSVGERGNTAWSIRPLNNYFYEGLAGIAVYFRALNRMYEGKYNKICDALEENLFSYTDEICERKDGLVGECSGVFNGESGLIYTYQLLYCFTGNKKYLEYAERHIGMLEPVIQRDSDYDIIYGNAGALNVLLNMYELTEKKYYMKLANEAGKVLLDGQIKSGNDKGGWIGAGSNTPLSGFSHGAAGILWSLARLWKVTADPLILDAIQKGMTFEDSLFDWAGKNWIDRRQRTDEEVKKYGTFMTAWCHGAAGILLSRVKMYDLLPEVYQGCLQEDAAVAVETTLNTGFNSNDCLCHGTLGNTEIILEYCKTIRNPEIQRQCSLVRNQIAKEICNDSYDCGRSYLYGYKIPGFMTGIAGMGYSLLRDIDKELPCILSIEI